MNEIDIKLSMALDLMISSAVGSARDHILVSDVEYAKKYLENARKLNEPQPKG